MSDPQRPSLHFDRFELQPFQRRLLRDGETVAMRPRAFDLLLALAERAGDLVTKGELLDQVWPGLVVEENNIAAQIVALRKTIGNELIATVPGRGYRFTAPVRTGPAPVAVAAAAASSLLVPADPRLFGREADLQHLDAKLQPGACVTLVGPGGVGKTALARAATARRAPRRAAWLDLAALSDGSQLHGALCRALQIASHGSPEELRAALAVALGAADVLLVLDNAEHLVDAAASLAAELQAIAPSLALLVTSQLPLRIAAEQVQPVDPLEPPAATSSDDEALGAASVQLLLERVRASDPRLSLGREALPLLRQLCTRLDGLPLALEMAAPMVPLIGLQGVVAALDERLAMLRRGRRDAPSRHKTLLAAMQWSHGLLEPPAQRVFRRLGAFASGFSLDLAVAVAADEGDDRWMLIDTVADLVDRSLVASLHDDPPRYRLLETTRAFALEQLDASGDRHDVQLRLVRALTAAMAPAAGGRLDPAAARELANVPEALAWARTHAPAEAIELTLAASAGATWTEWLGEAAGWVAACEPLLGPDIPARLQGAWWRELARFQSFVRGPRTVEAARNACAIERERGDATGLFWSLIPLLRSRVLEADEFAAARQEAQALLDAHPDWPPRHRAIFSGSLAMEYRRRGDFEAAWQHQLDEAEAAERAGLHQVAANARSNLAATLVGLGRYAEALERLDAMPDPDPPTAIGAHNRVQRLNALIGLDRLDDAQAEAGQALDWCRRFDVLDILQVLALLAARQGRAHVAGLYLGHHRATLAQRGADLPADGHAPWREARALAVAQLGESALQAALQRGEQLSPAEADRLLFDDPAISRAGA